MGQRGRSQTCIYLRSMEPDGSAPLDTTIELQRTRRLLRSTTESTAGVVEQQKQQLEIKPVSVGDGDVGPEASVGFALQRLLNVIISIFARDLVTDNALFLSQTVKCSYTDLRLAVLHCRLQAAGSWQLAAPAG